MLKNKGYSALYFLECHKLTLVITGGGGGGTDLIWTGVCGSSQKIGPMFKDF